MKRATQLRRRAHPVRQVGGNPFKELRESLNLTLEELARKTALSKQAIIRCEQGTYSQPLPALMSFAFNRGENEHDFATRYADFQHRTRHANAYMFGDSLPNRLEYRVYSADNLEHPFRTVRGAYNPTEVAKALCVPQATITYFERKSKQQKSVPKALIEALLMAGYNNNDVSGLVAAYDSYRVVLLGGTVESPLAHDLLGEDIA